MRPLDAASRRGLLAAGSTGVELTAYLADDAHIALTVRATSWSKYCVQFVGREGRVLAEVTRPREQL